MNLKHVLINSKWKDKSGHIYLWQDIWFGETPLVEFASGNPPITLCAEVMLLQNGIWNTNLFSPFLPQNIRQAIIQENLSLSNVKDHLIWKPDPKDYQLEDHDMSLFGVTWPVEFGRNLVIFLK